MDERADPPVDVEVKIKDNGLDTIEVADNGAGISEADWQSAGAWR